MINKENPSAKAGQAPIDCTTDPFVALWFLCDDDKDDVEHKDGILLALQRKPFIEIEHPYNRDNYAKAFDPTQYTPARLIYTTPPIDADRSAARRVRPSYGAEERSRVAQLRTRHSGDALNPLGQEPPGEPRQALRE